MLKASPNSSPLTHQPTPEPFVKKIISQTKMLSQFPRIGRKVPEFDDENVRELIVYSYRIVCRLQKDVIVAAVIHGKRNLQ